MLSCIIHDSSKPNKKSQFSSIQCLSSTKFSRSEIEKKTNQMAERKRQIVSNEHCKREQFDFNCAKLFIFQQSNQKWQYKCPRIISWFWVESSISTNTRNDVYSKLFSVRPSHRRVRWNLLIYNGQSFKLACRMIM